MANPVPLVFVVDDDDSVRRALERLIRSAGHRVEVFASAREFLGNAGVGTRPACLVLDIELPDVNGLQLQRELGAALPIIFITGHGDIAMTVRAMKAGACDFLPKPVRDVDLLHAIEQALERASQNYLGRCELDTFRRRFDKQVASDLSTAEKTIKVHRARVMAKMEVTSLAQLVHIVDSFDILSTAGNRLPR
jgi:FixJ family two-component response regulator